jgi:short-subunit dehydrogenase
MPMIVSYTATKHAVVGMSLALRVEAARAGVRVSVLCPGVIRTPILEKGGVFGKNLRPVNAEKMRASIERSRPMDPAKFAQRVLPAVARNQAIIIVPGWWKLYWWLNRLSPWLGERMAQRLLGEFMDVMAPESK